MKRTRIQLVAESGAGLLSVGEIVTRALWHMGYHVVADREFPSLIKGGHSRYIINVDDEPIRGLSQTADIMVAITKKGLVKYLPDLKDGGVLIHGYERTWGIQKQLDDAAARGITVVYLPARETAHEAGGNDLMANMVLTAMLWRAMDLPYEPLAEQVRHKFASKPKLLEADLRVLDLAYNRTKPCIALPKIKDKKEQMYLSGAEALALGAVHAGVRLYVGYPMSPSTGVLIHIANMANEYNIALKQAEDEITAAQMCLGGMYAGTRALTATSGGGFDLMTETLSLSGITETPLVIIIAQRPGPGTGLPTWTAQGDLHLAIRGGHGEFARIVMAASNPNDCFTGIQHAMNLAETYQVPVLFLTDKTIQDATATVEPFAQNTIPITRGLIEGSALASMQPSDRFKITESGVSPRWVPTHANAWYFANGDEHDESGTLTEDAEPSKAMIAKRIRKLETIRAALPEPETHGATANADIVFVGWGSTKSPMLDAIRDLKTEGITAAYVHYEYVWPLRTEVLKSVLKQHKNVHMIEGNATGQIEELFAAEGVSGFMGRLRKWDGRQFFVEDIVEYARNHTQT